MASIRLTLTLGIIQIVLISLANSQQYNCIQGFAYNSTYSSCMPTSIVCPQGSSWNGQICAYSQNCPANSVSNGSACVSYTNSCPPQYFGTTTQCFRCPNGFVQYYNSIQCTINFGNCTTGYYWNGNSCASTIQANTNTQTPTLPPNILLQNNNNLQTGLNPNNQIINTTSITTVVPTLNSNSQFPINQNQNQNLVNPVMNVSQLQVQDPNAVLCNQAFYWNGEICQYFNGVRNCKLNLVWNGTHCSNPLNNQNNASNNQIIQLLAQNGSCTSPSYYWNGNACVFASGQPLCIQGYRFIILSNRCQISQQIQLMQQTPQQGEINCVNPYFFNGATCVYNNGQPSCINGFTFNRTSNRCQPTNAQIQNSCNPPFYFNGISCMINQGAIICSTGFVSNGSGCVLQQTTSSVRGPSDCNSSTFWNGITCSPFNGMITCSSGYSWNGQQCASSSSSLPNCTGGLVVNPSTRTTCISQSQSFCQNGNYWNGEVCRPYSGQYTCIQRFYYNGVNCSPITGYVNSLRNQNVPAL